MNSQTRSNLLVAMLCSGALLLILLLVNNPFNNSAPYSTPVWWVSLTAPQYPATAFPDGIRIHFHVDGVFNGCEKIESAEKYEEEALNCKHEMDAINHYVGMYPIAAGAPVERVFSPFVFTLLSLMVVAFAIPARKLRLGVLALGCAGIVTWISLAIYAEGGVGLLTPSYRADMMGTMDLEAQDIAPWSGFQAMQESYQDALGLYFRDLPEIQRRASIIATATHVVFGVLVVAMVVLVVGVAVSRWFYWLLLLVPMALPLFFIVDYAGWLWWFGHNLNAMGAFSVKPFMPTVFGQGKVAQFATHSYPYTGFAMMMVLSALLAVAALVRRKQVKDGAQV